MPHNLCIICKHIWVGVRIFWQIVYIDQEEYWSQNKTLHHSTGDLKPVWEGFSDMCPLFPSIEIIYSSKDSFSHSSSVTLLLDQPSMWCKSNAFMQPRYKCSISPSFFGIQKSSLSCKNLSGSLHMTSFPWNQVFSDLVFPSQEVIHSLSEYLSQYLKSTFIRDWSVIKYFLLFFHSWHIIFSSVTSWTSFHMVWKLYMHTSTAQMKRLSSAGSWASYRSRLYSILLIASQGISVFSTVSSPFHLIDVGPSHLPLWKPFWTFHSVCHILLSPFITLPSEPLNNCSLTDNLRLIYEKSFGLTPALSMIFFSEFLSNSFPILLYSFLALLYFINAGWPKFRP